MNEKRFSIGDAVRFGWDTMKGNIGFFIALLIVAFLIVNIPGAVGNFASDFPLISFVLILAGMLLSLVVQMGLIKVSLKFSAGIKGKLDDLLSSFNLLLKFIAGSIVYGLIVLGGSLLLFIPGIIWGVKFSLFPYFIVDRELGPIEALKASSQVTAGAKWQLFLLGLVLGLINLAGALVFLVGLFATVPISMVAYARVYRTLAGNEGIFGKGMESGPGEGPDESPKTAPIEGPAGSPQPASSKVPGEDVEVHAD
jgi:uncharacterized membrane protein